MWTLGQRIKELRKEANLTQQELSEGIVTRAYISQIEKGLVQPSYETLKLLAERLRCRVEDLFVEPENKIFHLAESKRKIKMAEAFIESGQVEQASKVIQSLAHNRGEQLLTNSEKGVYLWIKGKLMEKERKWESAVDCFSQSKVLLAESSNIRELVRSIDSLGYSYLQLNKNYEALTTLNEGLYYLAKESIGGILQISIFLNIGIAHGKMGEYHSAIRLLQEAKAMNKATGLLYKHGQILMSLGVCYRNIQRLHEAETSYRKALSFFEMSSDWENCAGTKTNLGVLYRILKQYEQSIHNLTAAIELYQQLQLPARRENALLELAHTYMQCHRYAEAKQVCQDLTLSETEDIKHRILAHRYLGDIAWVYANGEEALRHYEISLRYQEEHGLLSEVRETYNRIAGIYYAKEEYKTAAEYYRLANQ